MMLDNRVPEGFEDGLRWNKEKEAMRRPESARARMSPILESPGISREEAKELARLLKVAEFAADAAPPQATKALSAARSQPTLAVLGSDLLVPVLVQSASHGDAQSPDDRGNNLKAAARKRNAGGESTKERQPRPDRQPFSAKLVKERPRSENTASSVRTRQAPRKTPQKDLSKTRVSLWPEYADLDDGDVAAHVERHYCAGPRRLRPARMPKWKLLSGAQRARRRLELRLRALRHCGLMDVLRSATIATRSSGTRAATTSTGIDIDGVRDPPQETRHNNSSSRGGGKRHLLTRSEIQSWSVQVAARVRGELYIDTLASSHDKTSAGGTTVLVDSFMDWLRLLGCPIAATPELEAYEARVLKTDRDRDLATVDDLLTYMLGAVARDVGFAALEAVLSGQPRAGSDQRPTLGDFGARAYDDIKLGFLSDALADDDPASNFAALACLVHREALDLQEIFLDAPICAGRVRDDTRVAYPELRRGLARLLACLGPPDNDSRTFSAADRGGDGGDPHWDNDGTSQAAPSINNDDDAA